MTAVGHCWSSGSSENAEGRGVFDILKIWNVLQRSWRKGGGGRD